MTEDDTLELTRRKILAGIGAVGAAGAGAGLGTSALFSDEEAFTNNILTAGTLDLKVDWEEHYYRGDRIDAATQVSGDPSPTDEDVDYYLPAIHDPDLRPVALEFTDGNDQDALWNATAIEAFPDSNDDGLQDDFDQEQACSVLTDVGVDEDGLSADDRTSNSDGDPLINLQDVKPGDFGEVTFSFHLCDNPGYVWMQGELAEAAENGVTEPEGDSKREDGNDVTVESTIDSDYGKVELLDAIRTRMWYDANCDNQLAQSDEIDMMIAVDDSISSEKPEKKALHDGLTEFISELPDGCEIGSLTFGDGTVNNFKQLGAFEDKDDISYKNGSGNTPLPPALDIAAQELESSRARSDAEKVIVAFTDGGPNYGNETYSVDTPGGGSHEAPRNNDYTLDPTSPGYDGGGGGNDATNDADPRPNGISDSELKETAAVAEQIRGDGVRIITVNIDVDEDSDPVIDLPAYLRTQIASSQAYAKHVELDDLAAVGNGLASVATNEDLFFEGTLREALAALSADDGIPLDADPTSAFNEFSGTAPNIDPVNEDGEGDTTDEFPDDGPPDPDREAFAGAGSTHCVGFEWWVPVGVGNWIQSDSVAFDLGFYTQQARNNDGGSQT